MNGGEALAYGWWVVREITMLIYRMAGFYLDEAVCVGMCVCEVRSLLDRGCVSKRSHASSDDTSVLAPTHSR